MTREEAIQWLTDIKENITENWSHDVAVDMAIEALSADAVSLTGTMKYLTKPHNYCEVVRCKDCKNGKYEFVDNKEWIYCKHHFEYWVANDFCSYGERGEP